METQILLQRKRDSKASDSQLLICDDCIHGIHQTIYVPTCEHNSEQLTLHTLDFLIENYAFPNPSHYKQSRLLSHLKGFNPELFESILYYRMAWDKELPKEEELTIEPMIVNNFPVGTVLKFPKDNQINYYQDFSFEHIGIPSHVPFTVTESNDENVTIIANGYGVIGKYGNGAITVSLKYLDESMKRTKPAKKKSNQ